MMLFSVPASCLVHTVNYSDSQGGLAVKGDILCALCVCWQNRMQHLSEMLQFPGFLFPQVVQNHALGKVGK